MARWHSCNVLSPGAEARELWRFQSGGTEFKLSHHETKLPNEPLTDAVIAKDWQTLYQKKLNVAWLPSERVFWKVLQIPAADFAEAQSMIELQLEKISPIPVAQAVWGFELIPGGDQLRSAIIVIVERSYVEQFLGKLEEQRFLADRLEIPFIDLLMATKISGHGVWIYPGGSVDKTSCLVAWWYHGVLQSLAMIRVPREPEAGRYLRQQLAQMAWAGELEGWVTSPPRWHLVASPEVAVSWEPWLREEGHPLDVLTPAATSELAVRTARRATGATARANLLPPEFGTRYRQIFIDHIWMRGLGAVAMVVVVGTLIYLGLLQIRKFQVDRMESEFLAKALSYTNAIKIKAEMQVLQDQVDLQYSALECWRAVSTNLPPELTLEGISFQKGKTLTVFGSGPAESATAAGDYDAALRGATFNDQLLFTNMHAPDLRATPGQGLRWTITTDLKRNVTE